MTITHGKGGGASAGADLMKSTFEVQRALQVSRDEKLVGVVLINCKQIHFIPS